MSKQFGDLQFIGHGEWEYYEQFFAEPEPQKPVEPEIISGCKKSSRCVCADGHEGPCDYIAF